MARSAVCLGGFLFICACVSAAQPQLTSQGWNAEQQQRWYFATQGSRLVPHSWIKALEQPGSEQRFLSRDHLLRFGLLPAPAGSDALPVGFAIDDNDDKELTVSKLQWFRQQGSREKWVGLNCSACHTAEIEYRGQRLRVDGGPSLFDFQTFIEALDAALRATRADGAKFNRFAKNVLGTRDDAINRDRLGKALDQLIAWEARVEGMNRTPLRYGHGRVDAFGHIYNKIALFSGAQRPTPNPADAPVSYPFLWDIYRHDKLQWNGIATNQRLGLGGGRYLDYGALGRNAGEVIGVFGDVAVVPGAPARGYRSSIWADNLIRLETQLSTLKAPTWPAATFGAPNNALVTSGRSIFEARCQSCHQRQPGTAPYKVMMVPLKPDNPNSTDPWMACNAISYRSATGKLEGAPKGYIGGGARYGNEAPLAEMLETTVKGALVGKAGQILTQTGRVFFGAGGAPRVVTEETPDLRQARLDACFAARSPYMAYKSRPLEGVWATAPYLHNGSVPTLYDLLRAPAARPAQFFVGTRHYDPQRVGYLTAQTSPGNAFLFRVKDGQGRSIPGNSNEGHVYGVDRLSEAERMALLEYLKTL